MDTRKKLVGLLVAALLGASGEAAEARALAATAPGRIVQMFLAPHFRVRSSRMKPRRRVHRAARPHLAHADAPASPRPGDGHRSDTGGHAREGGERARRVAIATSSPAGRGHAPEPRHRRADLPPDRDDRSIDPPGAARPPRAVARGGRTAGRITGGPCRTRPIGRGGQGGGCVADGARP